MTSLQYAFEVTQDDIENVLRQNSHRVANSKGIPFETLAEDLFDALTPEDLDRIAGAALDMGDDLEEQTDGAYEEIRLLLVQRGVLDR